MTTATRTAPTLSAAEVVFIYHQRTQHELQRYAAGPQTLDWSAQPNPFREYAGCEQVPLPLGAQHLSTTFTQLYVPLPSQALSLRNLGVLLELSMGLAAWKEYGPDRWALRCNPSSGNLHPTEAYVVSDNFAGLDDGVYHYLSRDHLLERRCRIDWRHDQHNGQRLWIGLSSVLWREAWKYGERAFRYCQLDVGHAIGALRFAAACLGWRMSVVDSCSDAQLGQLLGLDRDVDFGNAEREHPDVLLVVTPDVTQPQEHMLPRGARTQWYGQANVLDPHPLYRWPIVDEVADATTAPVRLRPGQPETPVTKLQPLLPQETARAVDIIRGRRSAQAFDRNHIMGATPFWQLLDSVLAQHSLPWDVWQHAPRVHPLLFVHRVADLAPGLYALPRRADAKSLLRGTLDHEFTWNRVNNAPEHLPLYALQTGDFTQLAKTVCCGQAIASDSCFTVVLLAEFEHLVRAEPWRYRQLHWEAGLLGQVLYLHAEALQLRGTGIGCYFDSTVHQALGLQDARLRSLYHFTIGKPLLDARISTSPPYPHRSSFDNTANSRESRT